MKSMSIKKKKIMVFSTTNAVAFAANEKVLDLYVIAGQSNASGYTNVSSVSVANDKAIYHTGFDNIYVSGRADGQLFNGEKVVYGKGNTTSHFGAEISLADKISEYSSNESVIFKFAYGGVYLVNNLSNRNWCPPSMCSEGDSGYVAGKTGDLFVEWKNMLNTKMTEYKNKGYTIRLAGTFWMQGEAEIGQASEYGVYDTYLKALISDMRAVYSEFGFENAVKAPFVIGKISPTYEGGGTGVDTIRQKQQAVANEMTDNDVYIVESYTICENGSPKAGCYDKYHFNGDDMLSLGKSVGEVILNTARKGHFSVTIKGLGQSDVSSCLLEGQSVAVTLTPGTHYYLASAKLINNETNEETDVLKSIIKNVYNTPTDGKWTLKVEFRQEEKYAFNISNDSEKGTVTRNPLSTKYYVGTEVSFTVNAKDGYEVDRVIFNGYVVEQVDGKYTVTTNEYNNLEVEYKAVQGGGHTCKYVCGQCAQCTDADCTDPVCSSKCQGHEIRKARIISVRL